uniref:Uncharacterized protein n=1 Tax=Oryza meridionalis TaxID=40149 RepID=A0A0E0E936_9ORYZ
MATAAVVVAAAVACCAKRWRAARPMAVGLETGGGGVNRSGGGASGSGGGATSGGVWSVLRRRPTSPVAGDGGERRTADLGFRSRSGAFSVGVEGGAESGRCAGGVHSAGTIRVSEVKTLLRFRC